MNPSIIPLGRFNSEPTATNTIRELVASRFDDPRGPRIALKSYAGCGCKVSGGEVRNGLCAASYLPDPKKFSPEDSALRSLQGTSLLLTTDGGLPVCCIPYLAARIAVVHAFSDVFARGGRPLYVLSTVMIDDETSPLVFRELLAGIRETALEEGAEVVNGQTIRGQEILLSVGVIGQPAGPTVLAKRGGRPRDLLMLSKPLGTGFVLRAIALESSDPQEEQAAVVSMCTSNRFAMERALEAGVTSCTDVTGFGLAGHLAEMTAGFGATVEVDRIPLLPGASRLFDELGDSLWIKQNLDYAALTHRLEFGADRSRLPVGDPQTSGPLLVTVPPAGKAHLEQSGFVEIGVIESGNTLHFN